jgi:hypothetical protein
MRVCLTGHFGGLLKRDEKKYFFGDSGDSENLFPIPPFPARAVYHFVPQAEPELMLEVRKGKNEREDRR